MLDDKTTAALAERLVWEAITYSKSDPRIVAYANGRDGEWFECGGQLTLAGVAAAIEGLNLTIYPANRTPSGWVITGWREGGIVNGDTLTEAVEAAVKEIFSDP